MKKKSFRWLWILLTVVMTISAVMFVCWDWLLLFVAPSAVLSSAFSDALTQLETRFAESPLSMVWDVLDWEGKYTADMKLNVPNPILGTVYCDMRLQANLPAHRFQAEGSVSSAERSMDLSLYGDNSFIAASSESLNTEAYYGITFDSFLNDIRNIPLLDFVVTDSTLESWDISLQKLQRYLSMDAELPDIPDFSEEEIRKIALGMVPVPRRIESRTVSANGEVWDCAAVTYTFRGAQINAVFSKAAFQEQAPVYITFYLHDNALIKVSLLDHSDGAEKQYHIILGDDPKSGELSLQATSQSGTANIRITTGNQKGIRSETWEVQENDKTKSYCFAGDNRKANVTLTEGQRRGEFTLSESESGLQMESEDFITVWNLLSDSQSSEASRITVPGSICIFQGSDIEPPEYKNLDQWSLEDFFILLEGIGSLIGIHIGV